MSHTKISPEMVSKVADLARLTLAEEERQALAKDMDAIVAYIEKLNELNTDDVEPKTHAIDLPSRTREDVPHEGISLEKGLQNSPERLGDGFGVPKIIE